MKDEDREQMQRRLRGRERKGESWREERESPPFGSRAGVSFMSSMLDLRLALPAGPGVHVCS